jgi:hypothetical protein
LEEKKITWNSEDNISDFSNTTISKKSVFHEEENIFIFFEKIKINSKEDYRNIVEVEEEIINEIINIAENRLCNVEVLVGDELDISFSPPFYGNQSNYSHQNRFSSFMVILFIYFFFFFERKYNFSFFYIFFNRLKKTKKIFHISGLMGNLKKFIIFYY